jgi:lipopolysaccharide export system ATP-binding protein
MRGSLKAVDLEKSFGSKKAVDKATIEVEKGEVVGLLGPNGAGKTTTFAMMMGLISPDGGRVYLRGEEITGSPMYLRARKGVGFLPQEPSAFRKLSVENNLTAVLESSQEGESERRVRISAAVSAFGLGSVIHTKAYLLSGGERRRLEISRAMILNPEFLLLDEPFTGIDPLAVQDLQEIIKRLSDEGLGILLTDHSVRETLKITDRAYILDRGVVIENGPPEEIVESDTVRKSYLGDEFRL